MVVVVRDTRGTPLGGIMWDYCGMERTREGLEKAVAMVQELKAEFWRSVKVTGENEELNQTLERAGRVADFFELAELMCIDALHRDESCGCHFRIESETEDGEALRDDVHFSYVAAWEFSGGGAPCCTKKDSGSTTSNRRSGATREHHPAGVASTEHARGRPHGRL